MGQEYFINSQELQDKVSNLLPSQGGAGAGFDLSASTQIIPIIDLTESAEGSNVRADLQTALSHASVTTFAVNNTTTTIITNTGYFRIYGSFNANNDGATANGKIQLNDGSTTKTIQEFESFTKANENSVVVPFDLVVFCKAGDSVLIVAAVDTFMNGCSRQIADINGSLVNPT